MNDDKNKFQSQEVVSVPGITNPLQANTTATAIIGYIAGIAAAKLPIFDLATWNYIFMSVGGVALTAYAAWSTRKAKIVSQVANLPEVKNIELDKAVSGTGALSAATPDNVVMK